jgi:hypothetical protein
MRTPLRQKRKSSTSQAINFFLQQLAARVDLHRKRRPAVINSSWNQPIITVYDAIVRACIYSSLHRHHNWSLDSEIYSSTLSTNNSTFGYHLSNNLLYYIDIQDYYTSTLALNNRNSVATDTDGLIITIYSFYR